MRIADGLVILQQREHVARFVNRLSDLALVLRDRALEIGTRPQIEFF
jgi:hypothetical protein